MISAPAPFLAAPFLSHKGYVTHQELTRVKSSPYLLHMGVAQLQSERPAYRSATSLRLASVSPSMYRWVIARLVWPASSCTSRRLPPTWETRRAARVIKVRRPECDEHPSILSEV